MRRILHLTVMLLGSLLLAAPVGAAHAARVNPWSAYFPAKGVTCTSTMVQADGTTETATETVLTRSAKKIVSRVTGEGRVTSLLLPGGKLQQRFGFTQRASGIRIHATLLASYPSPTRLIHHGHGSATLTMAMTMPPRMAKVAVAHGRTVTLTGSYRISGLGHRTVTLADPAATAVDAIGVRTALRSMRITNAKPAFEHAVKKDMRALFASMGDTEWVARGRGTVRADGRAPDGSTITTTQVACS